MQIVAYGAQDVFYYKGENKTTFNFNKSYQYSGKNNFYKKNNKKQIKEIKNKENTEKINIKNKNINQMAKVMNKTKQPQPIYKNNNNKNTTNINITNSFSNNFFRCLSIKLMIKKKIIELLIGNCEILEHNLIPIAFVKIYNIFLFVIIKQYYTDLTINIKNISLNTIDSSYLLKIKNIIIENNNIQKFTKILDTQIKIYFENKFGFKIKKVNLEKNLIGINNQNTKPNENCPITLEQLDNIYFYCDKCNTKYSPDGLSYWYLTNHKCSTPWCSNYITEFNFYLHNEKINLNQNNNSSIEQINYYYELIRLL